MKPEYFPTIEAEQKTAAIERAYENLDDVDRVSIDRIKNFLISKYKNVGEKGALELIDKLGMAIAEDQ